MWAHGRTTLDDCLVPASPNARKYYLYVWWQPYSSNTILQRCVSHYQCMRDAEEDCIDFSYASRCRPKCIVDDRSRQQITSKPIFCKALFCRFLSRKTRLVFLFRAAKDTLAYFDIPRNMLPLCTDYQLQLITTTMSQAYALQSTTEHNATKYLQIGSECKTHIKYRLLIPLPLCY